MVETVPMTTALEMTRSPVRQPSLAIEVLHWIPFCFGNAIMAAVFAAIVAITPMGIRELALIVWGVVLFLIARNLTRRSGGKPAALALVVQFVVACAVVTAAAVAPGKTKERILAQPMALPGQELTLLELQEYLDWHGRPIDGT